MSEWWEAPEWGKEHPMHFPDRRGGRMVRLPDDTDPVMVRNKHGQLRLKLVPARDNKGQMRPALRVYTALP